MRVFCRCLVIRSIGQVCQRDRFQQIVKGRDRETDTLLVVPGRIYFGDAYPCRAKWMKNIIL